MIGHFATQSSNNVIYVVLYPKKKNTIVLVINMHHIDAYIEYLKQVYISK